MSLVSVWMSSDEVGQILLVVDVKCSQGLARMVKLIKFFEELIQLILLILSEIDYHILAKLRDT